MTTYASGEFSPGIGNRPVPQATATFDGKIWLIGCGNLGNGDMYQTTLSLVNNNGDPINIAAGDATTLSNWTSGAFVPGSGGGYTYSRCAAAVAGDAMYLFWNQSSEGQFHNGQVFASRYGKDQFGNYNWSSPITIYHSWSTSPVTSNSGGAYVDVTATAISTISGNLILVACQAADPLLPQNDIWVAAFDPSKLNDTNLTWAANWESKITPEEVLNAPQLKGSSSMKFGNSLSMDWFLTPGPNNSLVYNLALFFPLENSSQTMTAAFVVAIDLSTGINFSPSSNMPNMYVTTAVNPDDGQPFAPAYVIQEPAGRPAVYYMADKNFDAIAFSTFAAPATVTSPLTFPYAGVFETGAAAGDDGTPPCVTFYIDMAAEGTTEVNGQPANTYPVYRFLFYGGGDVCCQIIQYGTIQVIPNSSTIECEGNNCIIARGIFDAPIPYPDINNTIPFQDTQPNAGTIFYGETTSNSAGHQVSTSLLFGFQTDGQTNKGFGPAWEISFNCGPGKVTGSGTETILSKTAQVDCLIGNLQNTYPTGTVIPNGHVIGTTILINTIAYQFLDANGNMVSDPTSGQNNDLAPRYGAIGAGWGDDLGQPFTPYTVIPGDLCSYTPERINATMKALGYQGEHYFEDEIVPNGQVLDGSTEKYMSVYWDEAGPGGNTSAQYISSSYVENSLTFEGSAYAGVGWGGDISFFGITTFEDVQAQLLVGGSISSTTETSTDQTTSIQLSIAPPDSVSDWGPPVDPSNPNRVISYGVRIYFLPPPVLQPNKWVLEFNQYATPANMLDQNTAAWRVFCAVTEIIFASPGKNYQYNPTHPVVISCS